MRQLTEAAFRYSVTPSDWEGSFILNLYMDKGGVLDCGTYHGLKLTYQVMKLSWVAFVTNGMYPNGRSFMQVFGQCIIPVLEALWCEFCTDVTWVHLYAYDLVLIADTQEECIPKLRALKAAMASKAFRVHKTKFLVCGVGHDILKTSGKYPCAVCCSGVGNNSIKCWWGAVRVPLQPDVVWPGESSRNSCLS